MSKSVPRTLVHDEAPTKTPTHPSMAGAFDRLVESNLELVSSVKGLTAEVRLLIEALAKREGV